MEDLPDIKIIRGILEHDNRIIEIAYNENFPMVERMVLNSGGDREQAKDIFQEGWIIIYKKLRSGELDLSCKFSTFLYAVCRKVWQQEKRKRMTRIKKTILEPDIVEESEPLSNENIDNIKKLYQKHFMGLSVSCQKLLRLHFNNTPIEEIQKIMKYQNAHYVMDRKYRCKKSLIIRIMKDPNFKILKHEYSGQFRSLF